MKNKQNQSYLTVFFRRHSVIALICGIFTLVLSFNGIISGVIRTIEVMKVDGFKTFIFYTMLANTLSACSIAFIIPYAVDGIQKRRFVLPKWVAIMHFLSVVSITIMMVFVLAFMSWISPYDAFGGKNIIMHIICPILILISFFQIENRYIFTIKDCLIGCVPFCIYIIVYFIEVSIIGETNGGWPDIYCIQDYLSPTFAIPLLLVLVFSVSWLLAIISNYFTKIRDKKMFKYWKNNINPKEAKNEAYRIGTMMSHIKDRNSIIVPLDIFEYISKKSNVNINELVTSYIKGLINSQKESANQLQKQDLEKEIFI